MTPDPFAYPTYAKAAIARRKNLKRSADELRIQLEDAKSALGEAFDDFNKVTRRGTANCGEHAWLRRRKLVAPVREERPR